MSAVVDVVAAVVAAAPATSVSMAIPADRSPLRTDVLVVGPRLTSFGLVAEFPADRFALRTVGDATAAVRELAVGPHVDVIIVVLSPQDDPAVVIDRLLACGGLVPMVAVFVESPTRQVTMAVIERRVGGFQLLADGASAVVAAVDAVQRGQPALHPVATQCLLDAWNLRTAAASATDLLTAREHEVLRLVVGGLQNKQIARRLAITEGTVKCHLSRIYQAIGVHSRTEAALWLAENEGVERVPTLHRSAS